MKQPLDSNALDQLFRTARTFPSWRERPVTDEQIHELYDLLKWGPTSMNCLPGRFVFLRAPEAKARLEPSLMAGNVDKARQAPVTVIVAQDTILRAPPAPLALLRQRSRDVCIQQRLGRVDRLSQWNPAGDLPDPRCARFGSGRRPHVGIRQCKGRRRVLPRRSVPVEFPGQSWVRRGIRIACARAATDLRRSRGAALIPATRSHLEHLKTMDADVIIIGAGISGLACALAIRENGLTPLLLDASDAVGGRIRTDKKGGFLLDRGFQVLQTWYPQARRVLDYAALDLRPFDPGALVRFDGRFHRVTDVWRRPSRLLQMAMSPMATPADKLRMLMLRRHALKGDLKALYERPETDALIRLQEPGFSPRVIERFFKPFFAGVFFEQPKLHFELIRNPQIIGIEKS